MSDLSIRRNRAISIVLKEHTIKRSAMNLTRDSIDLIVEKQIKEEDSPQVSHFVKNKGGRGGDHNRKLEDEDDKKSETSLDSLEHELFANDISLVHLKVEDEDLEEDKIKDEPFQLSALMNNVTENNTEESLTDGLAEQDRTSSESK